MSKLQRLRARWWLWRHSGDALTRRVSVERYLWQVVEGKKPPVDAGKARELAIKLGVPDKL